MSMTPKQNLIETVRGGAPERPAAAIMYDGGAWISHHAGVSVHDILASPDAGAALSLKGALDGGSDVVYPNMAGFGPFMEALGCEVDFTQVGQAGTILKPALTTIEDFDGLPKTAEEIRERALSNSHVLQVLEQLKGIVANNTEELSVGIIMTGPFTFAGQMMVMDTFLKGVIRKPKLFKEYVDWAAMAQKVWADLQLELGGDFVMMADPLASGDVISPRVFEQLAKPALMEVVAHIDEKYPEAIFTYHMCGHSHMRLESLKDVGIDVFSFDKNDIKESLEVVDGAYALFGNLDPTACLLEGSVDEVAAATRELREQTKDYPKFIVSAGCDLAPATPVENVRAMTSTRL